MTHVSLFDGTLQGFALTYKPGFFEKLGFSVANVMEFPRKVWNECYRCPKFPRRGWLLPHGC